MWLVGWLAGWLAGWLPCSGRPTYQPFLIAAPTSHHTSHLISLPSSPVHYFTLPGLRCAASAVSQSAESSMRPSQRAS
ncbi:hypothetical protein JOL62DRAFT_562737 [Phyllosticta paracitricarpa]|uniref:Secreted protein n=1 Tax=Phyllosticta paracitricarpa TaxID=2016321 RepID=A0ABR1NL65_9PEZI